MRYLFLNILLFFCSWVQAQTFSGGGGPIPDDGNEIVFAIPVTGLPAVMDTQSFGIEQVCFDITHTWTADVSVTLIAPDGTATELVAGLGGDTDGFVETCLSGNASTSIYEVWYPFTGQFRPLGDMGLLNNGQNPNGIWRLRILDTYAFADEGALNQWSITFGANPCVPFQFESSDLPIVRIETYGQTIPDDPKIFAMMDVIDNGPGNRNYPDQVLTYYTGPIGIELHGNSSQGFPKKSYRVETRDLSGEDVDVALMGMPPISDFVLSANFSDKTLMRNPLTYELSRRMGEYATRTRFCEVLLNGSYRGVYVLTERIKRGNDQVDIARLTPDETSGVDMTGGYIVKIDRDNSPGWFSPVAQPNSPETYTYFQFEYPRPDVIAPAQYDYMRGFTDSFELALQSAAFQDQQWGWRRFADEQSFIDFLILNEWSKNVDGYRLSTYFHKDRDDRYGKIKMGPVWDFDLGWLNADYCDAFFTEGWAYDFNYICGSGVPFWWERLMQDSLFRTHFACRWQQLRAGELSTEAVYQLVDSMALAVAESQERNFRQWPILGVYVWPNPGVLPTTYAGEIEKLKTWLTERAAWMDDVLADFTPNLAPEVTAQDLGGGAWSFLPAYIHPSRKYFWQFGDGATAEGATVQHVYPTAGAYTVTLTESTPFGCEGKAEAAIQVSVSTTSAVWSGDWLVYPNPAHQELRVQLVQDAQAAIEVRLLDLTGREMRQQVVTDGVLPLNGLPDGVYQLLLHTTTDPDRIARVRLVVAR